MPNTPRSELGHARRGLKLLAIFVAGIVLFVVSLTAVFMLPQSGIIANLKPSIALLRSEGPYPRLALGDATYQLDNVDDAHWLDIAISTQPGGPLVNAMGMFTGAVPNGDTIATLANDVAGHRQEPGPYAYYWHGYQLFLRPALLVFDYAEIRYLNMMLMGVLALLVTLVAVRKADVFAAGAFLFALLFSGFWVIPLTVNFSSDAYLMLLGSLLVLIWAGKRSFRVFSVELFFVLGMLTAFFDNLTNPLITLGMPLAFALIVFGHEAPSADISQDASFSAKVSVAWAVGYVGSWFSKWLIASAVLKQDVVREGVAQFMFRAGANDTRPHQLDAILGNILHLFTLVHRQRPAGTLLYAGVLVVVLGLLLWFHRPADQVRRLSHVLLVAPLPFVYYVVASNHTMIHSWITYRTLALTVFSVAYFALASIDFRRVGDALGPWEDSPATRSS